MNYTDGLFAIPVRIYDGFSMKKAQKREETMEMPIDGEWVEGIVRIPYNEVKALMDYYSKGRTIEEVEREGFDCCVVITNTMGEFIANISQPELMDRLNKFVGSYTEEIERLVEEELDRKLEEQPEEKKWWQKFRR